MLPRMTGGNWFFWSVMVWIAVNVLWIGLIEMYVTQWVGLIIATLLAIATFKWGPRPQEIEGEEEE